MTVEALSDINEYSGTTINPMAFPNDSFELYSVPSFDNHTPEIVQGKDIGSTKITVEEDDVLICKINPRINRVWVVKHTTSNMLLASSEWIVVRNRQMNPYYLMWYFSSDGFRKLINAHVAGIGGSLTRAQPKQVAKYPVPLVPRDTQDQIAVTFSVLDTILKKRKQQLEKLDLLVKSRFVEMFGDPVTNDNKYNQIPLERLCSICSSKRIFEKEYVDKGVPFYRTKEVVELSKGNKVSTELFITRERFEEIKMDYGVPQKNDLLITAVGTIGTIWVVDGTSEFYFKDGNLLRICASNRFNSIYIKNLLERLIPFNRQQLSAGTAYAALTIIGLKRMVINDVPLNLQNQFSAFVSHVDKSKAAVQKSLDQLETLKKALMQKYFG